MATESSWVCLLQVASAVARTRSSQSHMPTQPVDFFQLTLTYFLSWDLTEPILTIFLHFLLTTETILLPFLLCN
ncbi:hypothetical protein BJ166DRAFT_17549 [Pestalotiopsis sp. NC0098]|nr:hypothetical protein BJ166DRAFT_17549 [Pestalotiopsis sp. NC0098]